MAAYIASGSGSIASGVIPRWWPVAEATGVPTLSERNSTSSRLVQRDEPCSWNVVAIVTVVCVSVMFITAVILYLASFRKQSAKNEQANGQEQFAEQFGIQDEDDVDTISAGINRDSFDLNASDAIPPIDWEWEFRRQHSKLMDLELGRMAASIHPNVLLNRADPTHGKQERASEDNYTEPEVFIVGAPVEDDIEAQSSVAADVSMAKAMPLKKNMRGVLKAIGIPVAGKASTHLESMSDSDLDDPDSPDTAVEKLGETGNSKSS
ncbi:uncharacterized protein F4822DRAFT_347650 [Hypoxylon trugodes]|uniref:uncharacterized protein n=1 Tax=Hypoxylon trugodes TaxID=326681 RepID=UPI002192E824|nr:uncharacterized protein F4822DRAFT_347650 [Hypoxylon trugodes]KAI1385570.1 hypothetical protein F4822DRAFT_347650 [Hypoxylon trugodes]